MKYIKHGLAALVLGLALVFGIPSTALAWGSQTNCVTSDYQSTTNTWPNFFASHQISVWEKGCIKAGQTPTLNFLWIKWLATPKISFPSNFPSTETVEVSQQPYVSYVGYVNGTSKANYVRWRFTVKQCVFLKQTVCSTWPMNFNVTPYWTRICAVGGTNPCGDKKSWG